MDRIIVAGHICLDITPTYNRKTGERIEDILKPGTLIGADMCDIHAGGAVANTGLAIELLGGKALLAAKIGDDAFGKVIIDSLGKTGAADNLIVSKGEVTSYSVVLAFPGIDKILIHNSGANDTFCSADLTDELIASGSHFHFGYPTLMKKMYKGSGAHLAVILKRVQRAGLTTSVDMAYVDPESEAGKVNWPRILGNILPFTDFFVPSFEDLCYMMDPKKLEMRRFQAEKDNVDITMIISIEDDVKPLAERCIELGAKVVLVKCGSQGIFYMSSGRKELRALCEKKGLNIDEWGKKTGFVKSFEPDEEISGVGAGDTCVAAFLVAMTRGKSLSDCVELAAASGAMCVSKVDAVSGLVPLEKLQAKIDAGWKKRRNSVLRKEGD